MVATVGTVELQCESMLTSWVEASLNVPVAMNCWVAPVLTVAFVGVMATETRVPEPTVTMVVPLTPDKVAVTLSVPAFLAWRVPLPRMLARLFFEDRQVPMRYNLPLRRSSTALVLWFGSCQMGGGP